MEKILILTHDLIDAGRSDRGGWSAKQLRAIGQPWPPLHGWKERLVGKWVSEEAYRQFLSLKGWTKKEERRRTTMVADLSKRRMFSHPDEPPTKVCPTVAPDDDPRWTAWIEYESGYFDSTFFQRETKPA